MTTPTLIVTRPRPQCAAWLAKLADLGVEARALPLIEILPARDAGPVQAAWAALAGVDLAVFVSPNAVEHFFARAEGQAWPAHTLAACVGPGSAQALAEQLLAAGARVDAVTVYHRAAPCFDAAEQALLAGVLARPQDYVWLFSSAEAVGHLLGQPLAGQRAIATHPRIADAARAAGFAPVVLARPAPEAVTLALKAL